MKEFKRDDQSWIESLPPYGTVQLDSSGRLTLVKKHHALFPGSKSSYREDIETGWKPAVVWENGVAVGAIPMECTFFNVTMAQNTAAFADIIGEYTRGLRGAVRARAIFTILCRAWNSYVAAPYYFGTRAWMHGVCRDAVVEV